MKKIISAKEQFENKLNEMKPTYADEVCGITYHYCEDGEFGYFFGEHEEDNRYFTAKYPIFEKMLNYNLAGILKKWIEVEMSTPAEILNLINMTYPELMNDTKLLCTYCDFLFCNAELAIETTELEDKEIEVEESKVIGAECTDINAISSMVEFLKSQLISKIEGAFDCIGEKKFKLDRMKDRDMFNDLNAVDNDMWLEVILPDNKLEICFNYAHDDAEVDSYPLTDLLFEELLCIYSQLHK